LQSFWNSFFTVGIEGKHQYNSNSIDYFQQISYHSVLRHITGHQNLVLNSSAYYEDANGKLTSNLSDFSSYSKKKWIEVPGTCQVVIYSPQNLNYFLDSSVYEDIERGFDEDERFLEDIDRLKDLLKKPFEGLWTGIPYEAPPGYLGLCTDLDMSSAEDMNVKRT
jgi:hypothetical protein